MSANSCFNAETIAAAWPASRVVTSDSCVDKTWESLEREKVSEAIVPLLLVLLDMGIQERSRATLL